MSYGDYGSYNWKKVNGKWEYSDKFENTSLINMEFEQLAEHKYGVEFDVTVNARFDIPNIDYYGSSGDYFRTNHSVIGDLEGYAVSSYKGSPVVLFNTKRVEEKSRQVFLKEKDHEVYVLIDEQYRSIAYVRNKDKEYVSICGYGIGWMFNGEDHSNDGEELGFVEANQLASQDKKDCLDKVLKLLSEYGVK